jgi:CBS domain-containing protein
MATTVDQIMSRDPRTLAAEAPISAAARCMRDEDIGDVVVLDDGRLVGILTDRDITVRVVAEDLPPSTPIRDVCSGAELVTIEPGARVADAARLMREKAVRRLPVVEGGEVVGVVSIGDLAIEVDDRSALAQVSAAEPNR